MAKLIFKPGTMLNPVPAVMVTCSNGNKDNIITIAWTGIVNSNPPMTYISVKKERYSHSMIQDSREFVINLVTKELTFAADYCGVRSGKDVDKFKDQGLTKEKGSNVRCPIIAESPVSLECKVKEVHQYPSHDMFVAEIVNVQVEETLLDDRGRICLEKAGLVAYSHGEYFQLKNTPLGKFGYSVMKPKTRKRLATQKHHNKKR